MSERSRAAESTEVLEEEDRSQDGQKDTVEVDGEQVSREELVHTFRNRRDWQRSLTQQSQNVSEIVKGMTAAAVARSAEPAPAAAPAPAPQVVIDLEAEINALPDAVEHPAEHNAALGRLLQKSNQAVVEQVVARFAQQQVEQAQQLRSETTTAVQGQSQADAIVRENVRLLDDTLDAQFPGLSTAQRQSVARELAALRGEQYGEVVTLPNRDRVFRYNARAIIAATKLADLTPAPVRRSARSAAAADTESDAVPAPPAPSASAKAHIDYLRAAAGRGGLEAEAAARHFNELPAAKRNEIHKTHAGG